MNAEREKETNAEAGHHKQYFHCLTLPISGIVSYPFRAFSFLIHLFLSTISAW